MLPCFLTTRAKLWRKFIALVLTHTFTGDATEMHAIET